MLLQQRCNVAVHLENKGVSTKYNKNSLKFLSEKISYTLKRKLMKLMITKDKYGHIYRITKIDEIQEILIAEREINDTNLEQNITEELIILV